MADKSAKWDQNLSGKFYVDDQCIACDACVTEAPRFFEMNDEEVPRIRETSTKNRGGS